MRYLLFASCLIRITLTLWGELQDHFMDVKYTDIDYLVFTDAARFVYDGKSPFTRSTYRYSPLLSYVLLPNIMLHPCWGKVLFSTLDILAACLIADLGSRLSVHSNRAKWMAAAWLLNPFTATISTRGSCDVVVVVMLLGVLWLLDQHAIVPAGLLYGLAVHFRVYPIIFAPSIALWILMSRRSIDAKPRWQSRIQAVAVFGMLSVTILVGLAWVFYQLYGEEFLHEAYLYHASRKDPRHNFSMYFYDCYLRNYGRHEIASYLDPGALAWVSQASCVLLVSFFFCWNLPLCWTLQTIVFVSLNKVSTAQYFTWYFGLMPVALAKVPWPLPKGLLACLCGWLIMQLHWLTWAYLLEFQGLAVFWQVWVAGVCFLLSNVRLLWVVMKNGSNSTAEKQKPT